MIFCIVLNNLDVICMSFYHLQQMQYIDDPNIVQYLDYMDYLCLSCMAVNLLIQSKQLEGFSVLVRFIEMFVCLPHPQKV